MNHPQEKEEPYTCPYQIGSYGCSCYECAKRMKELSNNLVKSMNTQPVSTEQEAVEKKEIIESVIKYPVRYDSYGQMIWDAENNKVLDIRGWGRIQYMKDPEMRQDMVGIFIAEAINEKLQNL